MYVNATQKPWDEHYQMFEFISNEIYNVVQALLPVIDDRVSIAGHRLFYRNCFYKHKEVKI